MFSTNDQISIACSIMCDWLFTIRWDIFCMLFLFVAFTGKAQFIEISHNSGITHTNVDPTLLSGGVAFLDYQNDGFEDVFLIGGDAPNRLFENQGNESFVEVTEQVGLNKIDHMRTMGISCGDLDNDGYTDLLITSIDKEQVYLFWNVGGKYFKEGSQEAGIAASFYSSSTALGDFNKDGHLDVYICNYNSGTDGDLLLKNNGDRTFSNLSHLLGNFHHGSALVVAFSDFDSDHDLDILVGNDFGDLHQPNRLFVNEHPKLGFQELSDETGWDVRINSMGIAIGDYDEDGDLDYYVSDIGDNYLFANQTNHSFHELARQAEVDNAEGTSWGNAFFDYNNDSYLDLFVANGIFQIGDNQQKNRLFEGNGQAFKDVSELQEIASTFRGRGVAVGDFNNDGHQDLLVGVVHNRPNARYHTLLYENPGNENNWIKINLIGTMSNKDAYGSLVKAFFEGRCLIKESSGGGSYLSGNSKVIHFGLGTATSVDSLVVTWPNTLAQVFTNLAANQHYEILEGGKIYRTRSIAKTIPNGDEIFLQGKQRNEAGVYTDTIETLGQLPEIVKTRLSVSHYASTITGLAEKPAYQIWPIPFLEHINISPPTTMPVGLPTQVTVYDVLGKVVFSKSLKFNDDERIAFSHLALTTGTYLIQIHNEEGVFKQKIYKK